MREFNKAPLAQGITLEQLTNSESQALMGDSVKVIIHTSEEQYTLDDLNTMLLSRYIRVIDPPSQDNGIVTVTFTKRGDSDVGIVGSCAFSALNSVAGWQLFTNRLVIPGCVWLVGGLASVVLIMRGIRKRGMVHAF